MTFSHLSANESEEKERKFKGWRKGYNADIEIWLWRHRVEKTNEAANLTVVHKFYPVIYYSSWWPLAEQDYEQTAFQGLMFHPF